MVLPVTESASTQTRSCLSALDIRRRIQYASVDRIPAQNSHQMLEKAERALRNLVVSVLQLGRSYGEENVSATWE
jgi:hypothetical protein